MTVTATDNPAVVKISENGVPGEAGANGIDGIGFNGVRKSLIDNPLSWLYSKNNIVRVLSELLTVNRPSSGNYTDIYGVAQSAPDNTPREEVEGWLIDNTETHTYDVYNNIPLLDNGFSVVLRVGAYSAASVSQKMFVLPGASGDLFSVGTDAVGNYLSTIRGSDTIEYNATTAVSATSATTNVVICTFSSGTLNVYINNSLAGTVNVTPTTTDTLTTSGDVTLAGDFTMNIAGLRFYDFVLNDDERTYLND